MVLYNIALITKETALFKDSSESFVKNNESFVRDDASNERDNENEVGVKGVVEALKDEGDGVGVVGKVGNVGVVEAVKGDVKAWNYEAKYCNITGFSCIISFTTAKHGKPLRISILHGIMNSDHSSTRKGSGNDSNERTTLYTRASRGGLAGINRYHYATDPREKTWSRQSRKAVEDLRDSHSKILRSTKQLRQTEGQIKIAGYNYRHVTTKNLGAITLPLVVLANGRGKAQNSLPFFSIANANNKVKALLHKTMLKSMGMR